MKKTLITATLSAILLLTGCADNNESPAPSESVPRTSGESGTPQPSESETTELKPVDDPVYERELTDFTYDSAVERVKNNAEHNGLNALSGESEELRDLYARAAALYDILFSNGANFPFEDFVPGFENLGDLPMIRADGNIYRCAMVAYDSFLEALEEVFAPQTVGEILALTNRTFYEHDGALWVAVGRERSTNTVREEYSAAEKTDAGIDILVTAYLSDVPDEGFSPENSEEYETESFHYIMTDTDNGMRVSDFPVYRWVDGKTTRDQISYFYPEVYSHPTPELMHNGEKYVTLVVGTPTLVDGEYMELDGEKLRFDAERMKEECEYLGKSISNPDFYLPPKRELEVTCTDEVYDLYRIDENQILMYSSKDIDIVENSSFYEPIVYPGTYREHYILVKAGDPKLAERLAAEYCHYAERYPDADWWDPEKTNPFVVHSLSAFDVERTNEVPENIELAPFEYSAKDFTDFKPELSEFLKELDMPEITEQCARAYTLLSFFSTENFSSEIMDETSLDKLPQLDVLTNDIGVPSHYYDSGINAEHFGKTLLDTFTSDAAERVFESFPNFCSHNYHLWFADCAITGDTGAVHEEYELISHTDSELLFRCTVFSAKAGEPLEYDPAKRDSYQTYTLDYKFVMTDDGWRADEFPIYSRTLDGASPSV